MLALNTLWKLNFDLTTLSRLGARIGDLQVNVDIDPRAFVVDIPSDADPMTLDELRSVAPLVPKGQ